jgi:hypothetical protein
MVAWLMPLISGITGIFSGIVGIVKNKIDARRAIQLAEMIRDVKLQGIETDAETIIAIERLQKRNKIDQLYSGITLLMIYAPFVMGLFYPGPTVDYFTFVVAEFPDWFIALFVGINLAQWGLKKLNRVR